MNGFKITTNWDGKGLIFDPSTQERKFNDWKPKVEVKETRLSNTHIIIESRGANASIF